MDKEYINDEYIEMVYKNISQNLRKEREKQGMTVIQLERKSGIDRTAIYKMENNKRRFGLENLLKICLALNIRLGDLYDIDLQHNGRSGGS